MFLTAAGAAAAFVYGVFHCTRKRAPLFNRLIVCGIGCAMLGRVYELLTVLVTGAQPAGFDLGLLGVIGCFQFILSASIGQMDSLIDGGEPELARYRHRALAAPAGIALMLLCVLCAGTALPQKLSCALVFLFLMPAAYYNLKHVMIPDVEMGILRNVRGYNLLALGLAFCTALQMMGYALGILPLWAISSVPGVAITLALVPVLERGSRKWTL